ncbi:MAG: type II toxin-antitoxin system RelE/ParE family toxin [Proteobacteria bacterium]|jgi:mRNA interferase RelE/StbE|nr:type II toxin-antitoxin system RelE/ParE family toxin [Pseudomonadota bacterium]
MANYEIEVSSTAEKQLRKLTQKDQISVLKRIQGLSSEPRPNHSRKLRGQTNVYRIRVGNYRILYSIEDKRLIIIVLKLGHRRDVYR